MPTWANCIHTVTRFLKTLCWTWNSKNCSCIITTFKFGGTNVPAVAHEALHSAWSKYACMSSWSIAFCMMQMCLYEHIKNYMQQHIRLGTNVTAWAHKALHVAWPKCACMKTQSIAFCMIQMCLHEHIKHYMQQNITVWVECSSIFCIHGITLHYAGKPHIEMFPIYVNSALFGINILQ